MLEVEIPIKQQALTRLLLVDLRMWQLKIQNRGQIDITVQATTVVANSLVTKKGRRGSKKKKGAPIKSE